MTFYSLREKTTRRFNDFGATTPDFFADRNPEIYDVVEGLVPLDAEWTHDISLRLKLDMLVQRAPGLDEIDDDSYLALDSLIDKAKIAKTAKLLQVVANKFRATKAIAPSVADWLEQGAIECEREALKLTETQ